MDENATHIPADDHAVAELIQEAAGFLAEVPADTAPQAGPDLFAPGEIGAASGPAPTSQAADEKDLGFAHADENGGRPYVCPIEKLAAAARTAANHPAGRAGIAAAALSLASNLRKLRAREVTFAEVIDEAAWVFGEAALTTVAVALAATAPAQ
jgi:hypothetical protein